MNLYIFIYIYEFPEHLVPHPLQGALYCIGCSLAGF